MKQNQKVIGIIFARYDSSRLPGKALIEVNKKALLGYVIDRAKKINCVSEIVLATTTREVDDVLVDFARNNGVKIFRGDLENVAKRALDCAIEFEADYFIRLNGDSPFLDFELINNSLVDFFQFDFITNLIPRSFPYGIAIEAIKTDFFKKVYSYFNENQKEHIFSYIYENMDEVKLKRIVGEEDLQHFRLTVDDSNDLLFFQDLVTNFGKSIEFAPFKAITDFITQKTRN